MTDRLRAIEEELKTFPGTLATDFPRSRDALAERLSSEELLAWGDDVLALARHSLRSWEAAAEYVRSSAPILETIPFASFMAWATHGQELASFSSIIARAYFHAGPETLPRLQIDEAPRWGPLGGSLYKGTWKSISLTARFFELGPAVLTQVDMKDAERLVRFIDELAGRSYDLALACLELAPQALSSIAADVRGPFLQFGTVLVEHSWADARIYFERGPGLVEQIEPSARARYLALAGKVAPAVTRATYASFAEASNALARVEPELHQELIGHAEALLPSSGAAAVAFLRNSPEVLSRVRSGALGEWYERGRNILETTVEGGEAFFRLESTTGEGVLDGLSSRIELSRIGEVLRLYCKALTGTNVAIAPSSGLAEKRIGWMSADMPSTEGTAIYLPEAIEAFAEKDDNFGVYKVYATHQAAHLEFGSFWFRFERPGALLGGDERQRLAARSPGASDALTDMERYFDLFPDRQLAADLFAVAEDTRIDARITKEYSGIRRAYGEVQELELSERANPSTLPLREALMEVLVRLSLNADAEVVWPGALLEVLRGATILLADLRRPEATVEDAAEVTAALYRLLTSLPNVDAKELGIPSEDWLTISSEAGEGDPLQGDGSEGGRAGEPVAMPSEGKPGAEQPYRSPDQVGFRGDFKPELVQLLMRLRQGDGSDDANGGPPPLSPEQLKELIEKSAEIDFSEMADGDLSMSSGMFVQNLMKEGESQPREQRQSPSGDESGDGDDNGESMAPAPRYFLYDEWDFRAADYKPRWCRLIEQVLSEGDSDFFEKTLRDRASLVTQTRKQFEMVKPELFRKIKRLYEGEEYDLDAAIEYIAERRSGHTPNDKVYWRRNKVERDVAVAFLLDMSASTDEEIEKRRPEYSDDDFDDDPRRYLSWWASRRAQEILAPPKRIIDVEKESIVLLITALETIGDAYGIYGFSGYGRDNVEFYVIKDIGETFGERIKNRIDKIAPIRSTRMGPAIRHATQKLMDHDSKVKILFLVSDGRPQDHGYGRDRTEKEYAIHDTKMALTEAKRKGVTPFALTVDRNGHDYLKQMCDDMGYEVLFDVEALPSRLPTLYRRLTE